MAIIRTAGAIAGTLVLAAALHAQGRGGGAWTTPGGDAQRTGWVRTDPRITKDSAVKPGLQLLWKRQLQKASGNGGLTQPVLLPNIISYKGFKALAFVGGGADAVYSIDYDLNRVFWETRLNTAAKSLPPCADGSIALTRASTLGAPAAGRGGRAGGGGGGGGGRGAGNNVYAVSSGGMVHTLNPQTGEDLNPPAKFTGGSARLSGAIFVDNTVYAAVAENCGSVAGGVYAIDLTDNANTVASWDAKGAQVAGSLGPSFAQDGTLFVATGASSSDATFANAVVALEAKSLAPKDWFTAATPFTSTPVVFTQGTRTLVAAANADGSLYVLDAASLGGPDHKTPLLKAASGATSRVAAGAIATWEDAGARMIAAAWGSIVAFRLSAEANTLAVAWTAKEVARAGAPMVVNGVLFAASNGAVPGGSGRSTLYALDAASGKALWNSGSAMGSYVPGVPPSAGDGQVFVVTADGMLYAFGMPLEH